MAKGRIKKGAKAVFSKAALHSLVMLAAGAGIYLGVPTAFNIQGTVGALTGLGSGTAAGVLFNNNLIALGSWITFAVHATYVYVNPVLTKSVGRPIFGWSQTGYNLQATAGNTGINGGAATVQGLRDQLQPGATAISADGKLLTAYNGSLKDVPFVNNGRGMEVGLNDIPTSKQPITIMLD